jgi:hypothetical protein
VSPCLPVRASPRLPLPASLHVVRQQTMKANMPKPELVVSSFYIALPIVAQRHRRVVASDRVFPEVRQWCRCFREIAEESESAHRTCRNARRLSSAVIP